MIALLLGVILALALVWAAQRRMIYFPYAAVPAPASVGLGAVEEVSYRTEDGLTLQGWFVRARLSPARFTVIVFNGNAGNRAYRAPLAAALSERGVATLLTDYRGYGGNPGHPSEEGLARDARAARSYLATRADVDSSRLVYFGESLGTGVAVRLALEHPPLALVLRSPYTSLPDLGRHHYPILPVGLLLRDRFPSLERIGGVACPLLVIASDADELVPLAQSERLYAAASQPKRLVRIDQVGHNDFELLAGERLIDAVMGLVAQSGG